MSSLESAATKAAEAAEKVSFVSDPLALPPKLPPVPVFDLALCPDAFREWVADQADALQVPPEFIAVPAIAAAGGVIGRQLAIRVKQRENWLEFPFLWAAVIGLPSSGKSPGMRPAIRFLSRLEAAHRERYESELKEYEIDAQLQNQASKIAQKNAAAALSKGRKSEARQHLEDADQGIEAPTQKRIVLNDATVEKAGEILNSNPRGLIQSRDELAGWLASLDREGREMDRSFWLECWNGHGPFTVDRIGRGTLHIEAPAITVIGGIQPGKLAAYVQQAVKGGVGDDGLIQRLQLAVFPDPPRSFQYVDRAPSPEAERRAWEVFQRLDQIDPAAVGAEGEGPSFLRMDPEGQAIFIEWFCELMLRLRSGDEPPFLESHLGKYPALAARLALTLHMIDSGRGPVSAEAVAKALDWCEFLEPHARRIYAPATDNGVTAAHLILAKRDQLEDGFSARDLYRKGWSGLDRVEPVQAGLNVLVEYHHLEEYEETSATKPSIRYSWRAPA